MSKRVHSLRSGQSNHAITAKTYANEAARDADLAWTGTPSNLHKVVFIEDSASYLILVSIGPPVWQSLGSITNDTQPHGGGGYSDNTSETVITDQDTFYVIAGTFVASPSLDDFTINAAGVLTYTGLLTRHVHIVSNFDFTTAANNQILQFGWFLNGEGYGQGVSRKAAVGGDVGAVSVHADAVMSTGDTLQLRVQNKSGTANMTCGNVYLFAMGMV